MTPRRDAAGVLVLGTPYTKEEARRAVRILDRALETDQGFKLARESGAVVAIFGALLILADYVDNSDPIPLQWSSLTSATKTPE